MAADHPYVKDPATSLFAAGGLVEAESLFGAPLPPLPPAERDGGREVLYVRFHPLLRTILRRFLHALLKQLERGGAPGDCGKPQAEYEAALGRGLRSALSADRGMGLGNLFWLAHSRDVAGCVSEVASDAKARERLSYVLPGFLAPVFGRVERAVHAAQRAASRSRGGGIALVEGQAGLLDAVAENGYLLIEPTFEGLNLELFITTNSRARFDAALFMAIQEVLLREVETRLHSGDRGLRARIRRFLPGLPQDQIQSPAGALKVALNGQVMAYLFADAWSTGRSLMASGPVRQAAERRSPSEVLGGFLDLVDGLKRFEILCHLRDRVCLGSGLDGGSEMEERARRGLRVYDFGEPARVVNNAIDATVLFLDLRGFTETSEGQVSERDLTWELYTVFDAFVPHVLRFSGSVDKFLGDGMMVTFGTEGQDPEGPLHALRTAILCQETLHRLRRSRLSSFRMGVSIHYGRVYRARFFEDDERVQTTVIGRNVNLAGRLSSAAKRNGEDAGGMAEPAHPPGLRVTIDESGALVNEGITLSRAALLQLQERLPLESVNQEGGTVMRYHDAELSRNVFIRYVGDAKFKGVQASFPVFEIDHDG
jgi:class 3 adenylate cyclase